MNIFITRTALVGLLTIGTATVLAQNQNTSANDNTNLYLAQTAVAKPSKADDPTTAKVVKAAESLLAVLNEKMRSRVQFDFDDDVQRQRWSNLPTGIFRRAGLRMGDLDAAQQEAVYAVLAATLSEHGLEQVKHNVAGDELLRREGGRVTFGEDEFYFSILGKPSVETPWMWQFGGHHLAINATIFGSSITLAPSLTGGQPIHYTENGVKEVHQLKGEYEKSFELINSLNEVQREEAILGSRYIDLVWGPGEDDQRAPAPEGIAASRLTNEQQKILIELISERVRILNDADAVVKMAEVKARLANTYFAWYGPTTIGNAAYFRIQGPTLWIEYAPQALGGSATDHIHAMYREPGNDYAVGWRNR